MKKLMLLILMALPFMGCAQVIPGFSKVIIAGSAPPTGGATVVVDTTFENKPFSRVMEIDYDKLRPNCAVDVAASCSFFMENVPAGDSGQVRFYLETGAETIQLNGHLNRSLPTTPGYFTLTYHYIGSILNWD